MKQLTFKTSDDWRKWLTNHHDKEDGVWLVFFKKGTGVPTIDYESAVEEALCFGWIDSIIKNIDQEKYVRKFTPRNESSTLSDLNKKRVARLIESSRMTESGRAKIESSKKNGLWDKQARPDIRFDIPEEFQSALDKNKKAKVYFNQLSPTYQKQYIGWIVTAKREETKKERIKQSISLLEKGEKLGLK